ncbi:hypothetical protein GCM10009123_11620 [Kangiella japonica]|uniref:Type II secretion system protein N n=1 Tax=Kangiella japonica TaxID=647384 RepID=A0ABN0SY05_9GAMM
MKKMILGALLVLVFFVVLLMALAPARVATPYISDIVPGVSFIGVEGTIWSFEAASVGYRQYHLSQVKLDTNPLALLLGSLNSDLRVDDNQVKISAELNLSNKDFKFDNIAFDIDASYIPENFNIAIDGAKGQISGTVGVVHFANSELVALDGNGHWRNAIIEYPNNNLELGNIEFNLSKVAESTDTLKLTVVENQGVLDLKGFIELSIDKSFTMKLHTSSTLPPNLKDWLTRWGRTQGDRIYLEWGGKLP